MGFLDSLGSGIGSLFSGGANLLGKGAGAIGNGIGSMGNSFMSGFGGGGNSSGNSQMNYFAPMGWQGGGNQNNGGGLSSLFKGGLGLAGSQLIGNQKPPALPASFQAFQQQANAGGPPITQAANQYNMGLINGTNTAAQDAATHSLDLNYNEQLRQLQGMYKSIRPGTDPTSDTTYQRDLANLNDQYTRQRAQTLAQQQQGAAQYGLQAGTEQANQQANAIGTQVSQQNAAWQAQLQKQAALRNMLMELSGLEMSPNLGFMNLFKNLGGQ